MGLWNIGVNGPNDSGVRVFARITFKLHTILHRVHMYVSLNFYKHAISRFLKRHVFCDFPAKPEIRRKNNADTALRSHHTYQFGKSGSPERHSLPSPQS